MRALIFDQQLSLKQIEKPVPAENEALIRVDLAGICNTDLEIIKGYMGFSGTLGHEFVGTVEACAVSRWVGRRVVGEINLGCGKCSLCLQGLSRHCKTREVLGIVNKQGAMADYLVLPVANLVEVPDALPDNRAVLVEPLAAAMEILEQVHVKPHDRVAIMGDGKLAWMIAQVMRLTGASVTVFGHHEAKCQRFQRDGIAAFCNKSPEAASFACVIEASGSTSGLDGAIAACQPRGCIVLKSTVAAGYSIDLAPLVIHEITLVGSRCGRFEPAIRALAADRINLQPLISEAFSLTDFERAFHAAASGQTAKVVFDLKL